MTRRGLENQRVLLTGASSGIGAALARDLARVGCRLLLVARREDRLLQLATELDGSPGEIEILAGDVTAPEVRSAAMSRMRERFGGLDILINNAGVGAMGTFDAANEERLRRVMEVNFFAPAEWIRDALPLLKQSSSGMIVNVSSVLGHRAVPNCSEYCASKFALQGLSESLRAELATQSIQVLVVSPGTTGTEFFDNVLERPKSYRWRNRPTVSAEYVATKIVRAIAHGKHEIIPSGSGRLLCWINRLSPRLTDWLIQRFA